MFDSAVGGGFVEPNRISYEVAPSDCQLSVGVTVTQVVPLGGFGELGVPGPGGPAVGSVVNDQIGPAVVPLLFAATICQKYVEPGFSRGVAYQYSVMLDATVGGGLVVPNRISYDVAPSDRQLSVGVTVTQVVPLAGFGEFGGAGPSGPPVGSVLKLQMGPAVVPTPFFATICQKYVVALVSRDVAYQ